MASTIENKENHSNILTEEPEETPEPSGDKISVKDDTDEAENGDESSAGVGKNLDEMSNSEIIVNLDSEKAETNADKNDIEIVEIEEKLIIETLDEAKDMDGLKQSEENIEVSNNGSENVNPGTAEASEEEIEPADTTTEEDEWIDLLGNELLKKKIIQAGKEDSSRPAAGQEVCVRSEGTLPNGYKVDVKNELKFIIGDGDVITAFDLCVPTMFENEICELATAPRFAYGTMGREDDDEGDVPPDSDVTYKLELLSIKPGPNISHLTDEQRIELGDQKRERGNDLFRREEYSLAVHSYTRALKYLGSSTAEAIVELKVKCWNNISASHLKLQEYTAAKNACDAVLEVDPNNVKALFRKGKVLYAEKEYEQSVEVLRKANSLDPDNKLIRRELYLVRQKYDENKQKERSMYQRMVGGLADNATPEVNNTFFTWPVILGITGIALGGVVAALLFSRH